jgi:predicted metalloprotease
MKWVGRRGSDNIEDRRMQAGVGRAAPIGIFGLLIILALGWFLGVDVSPFVNQDSLGGPQAEVRDLTEEDQREAEFVSVVLADTEELWTEILQSQAGVQYVPPQVVLYSQATGSPCGTASGATGPFYCPLDEKVYLDTAFFEQLSRQFGASGDFANAYVVAHEVGHRVQDVLGTLQQTDQIRRSSSPAKSNLISVMIELQADCYAGIWARYAHERLGTIEQGDLEEAMNAAAKIGDDTLQRNAGQRPMPDSFTHGSSEQRQRWFAQGYNTADMNQCNTFEANSL